MRPKASQEATPALPTSTARQDAQQRKTIFRTVLDSPLVVQWPSIPSHVRQQILTTLLGLVAGTASHRQDIHAHRHKLRKAGPVLPDVRPMEEVERPAVMRHLVVGINAVTKALETREERKRGREEANEGRRAKKRRFVERLTERVEEDKRRAGPIEAKLERTKMPTAAEEATESHGHVADETMMEDGERTVTYLLKTRRVEKKANQQEKSKRRNERRQACRDAFLSRRRAEQLDAVLAQDASTSVRDIDEAEKDQGLAVIFVCRADLDPPALVAHLPHQVATYNARLEDPSQAAHLVQLPAGAELALAEALGLRRAAVLGLTNDAPGLQPLLDLIAHHTSPPSAPWLHSARGQLQPTAIRHLKTDSPLDPRGVRKARRAAKQKPKQAETLATQT